jgi:hypothetical protein
LARDKAQNQEKIFVPRDNYNYERLKRFIPCSGKAGTEYATKIKVFDQMSNFSYPFPSEK